ncbi:MAG: DoxX family membrane protein [Limnochordaceae bacterium]|nr:DoxX family membrane protein [Limnochordaceae bacterium]
MDSLKRVLLAVVRVYVGAQWLQAAWGKLTNPAWVGDHAGTAITGFFQHSLQLASGEHPAVQWWYAWFIQHVALPSAGFFSYLVPTGEALVGIGLTLGAFTGFSALVGAFMNLNFMLAGATSTNPILFTLEIVLVATRKLAGAYGLDAWLQPRLLPLQQWLRARLQTLWPLSQTRAAAASTDQGAR